MLVSMILLLLGGSTAAGRQVESTAMDVWIGTSSQSRSRGIYHCQLDSTSGILTDPHLAAEIQGPGFLARHPHMSCLYAVGAINGVDSVVAYAIQSEPDGSALRLLNSVPVGDGPADHVAVDRNGSALLTAQYGGGSVALYQLNPDGSLDSRRQLIEHQGGSLVVPGRQDRPHPHWVGFSPDNRYVLVPDLGMDQVLIYRFDAGSMQLVPHGSADLPPGGGPRHLKFHPNGRWVYVLNELSLSVSLFHYDAKTGAMVRKQTIGAVPRRELDKEKFASGSEIRVHPNGQFVYSANRGHDTITVFRVNPQTGELTIVEREAIRGATPRNFNLDPTGRWLLAAGQDSHTLASFEVNPDTGELTFNRNVVQVPAPICVLLTGG